MINFFVVLNNANKIPYIHLWKQKLKQLSNKVSSPVNLLDLGK